MKVDEKPVLGGRSGSGGGVCGGALRLAVGVGALSYPSWVQDLCSGPALGFCLLCYMHVCVL